jgi:hypothetical protein
VAEMWGNSSVAKMWGNSSVAEMWGNSSVAEMWGNSSRRFFQFGHKPKLYFKKSAYEIVELD